MLFSFSSTLSQDILFIILTVCIITGHILDCCPLEDLADLLRVLQRSAKHPWKLGGEDFSYMETGFPLVTVVDCCAQTTLSHIFPLISHIWQYHICYISSLWCWHERMSPRVINKWKSRKLANLWHMNPIDFFLSSLNASFLVSQSCENSTGTITLPLVLPLCCLMFLWHQVTVPYSGLIWKMQTLIICTGSNRRPD